MNIVNAQTACLSIKEVALDSRCLYIYKNNIYEMGSRNSPHKGHPCGQDVTNVMPEGHIINAISYLLPNRVGTLCAASTPFSQTTVVSQQNIKPSELNNWTNIISYLSFAILVGVIIYWIFQKIKIYKKL